MALPVRVERGQTIDPLDIVRRDMNQLLGHVLGRGFFNDVGDGGALSALTSYGVDIREDADHIYVEADLPGFRKEDVDISLQDGVLTITAERREEISEPDSGKEGEGAKRDSQSQVGHRPIGRRTNTCCASGGFSVSSAALRSSQCGRAERAGQDGERRIAGHVE